MKTEYLLNREVDLVLAMLTERNALSDKDIAELKEILARAEQKRKE